MVDELAIMERLCADPLLLEHEAAVGTVFDGTEDADDERPAETGYP